MKRIMNHWLLTLCLGANVLAAGAQTDVTSKYMHNADFQARFAGWINGGNLTYNTTKSFALKHGEVFMEKYVSSGSKLGSSQGIYQTVRGLKPGTYTLVVAAQNIQQANKTQTCTGAFVYAGNEQVEVSEAHDYTIVFTVADGKADIGAKMVGCTGNWFCVDNFRLYYNGVNEDSLAAEQTRLDAEIATMKENIANATGATPRVVTHPYVAMGSTIALGRSTVTTNGATIRERGFCWSTQPEPTIFDDKTTSYFSVNGNLYRMEGLQPATFYYVRAYAITTGNRVAYGEVVKIATMPAGNMVWNYDNAGDEETNCRISSATQECVWMYNNICNITGFTLSVHYVPGAGAGGGTADCSYGGWMRVSQNTPYQQTGTMLHETNHGVGVGTTSEWSNNSILRENTTHGRWLGPRATEMVRFLENNEGAYMQGDGTHMWAGTTSGTLKYGYGINGAHEDDYQPSNQMLYYGNVFITHAMHQDGLVSTSGRGFATPAYVFSQDDEAKYYIRCEDGDCGGMTSFLGMTATGTLKSYVMTAEEAAANDNYAWNITYDPRTSLYVFRNVGTGKYMTNNNNSIKGATKSSVTTTEKFHLMPSRELISMGNYQGHSYWLLTGSDHRALQGSTSYTASTASYSTTTANYDATNAAHAQRWLLLTMEQVHSYEAGTLGAKLGELDDLLQHAKALCAVPHATVDGVEEDADALMSDAITSAETGRDAFASASQVDEAIIALQSAMLTYLADTKPVDVSVPYDLTFLLTNPDFETSVAGWTQTLGTAAWGSKCVEFFEETYDLNQTIGLKLPKGTYELRAQAFQRPGTYQNVYADYQAGTNNVKAVLYAKSNTLPIHNICDEYSTSSYSGAVSPATRFYIPDSMSSAQIAFEKGMYDNSLLFSTSSAATMKVGIKLTSSSTAYWTCLDNFRLYYYGQWSQEDVVTPVQDVQSETDAQGDEPLYDLQGRRVARPTRHGIYVRNGKKVLL